MVEFAKLSNNGQSRIVIKHNPHDVYTVVTCPVCGEMYEASYVHICGSHNSIPIKWLTGEKTEMSRMTVREKRIIDLITMSNDDFALMYIITSRDQNGDVVYTTSDGKDFKLQVDALNHETEILNTVIETGD